MEITNKTVSDYLKKITDEDPTVKLRKINKLAERLMSRMEYCLDWEDIKKIYFLSEEKK